MRTLGLDVGNKRIGVAISDSDGRLAVPVRVHDRRGDDARQLAEFARAEGVERIVVGLPVSLDGSEGEQAEVSRDFAALLAKRTDVEIVLYDERLSSAEADRHLQAAGLRAKQAKQHRDAVAAAIILQAYLDSLRFSQEQQSSIMES